jgi:PAS domain S-box-containing protein
MRTTSTIIGVIGATILLLPLSVLFISAPAFTRLAEQNANGESVRVANHLAASLLAQGGDITRGKLPANFPAEAETIRRDFRLFRLRVLSPAGEIVFSTTATEIGSFNRHGYFREEVARGVTQSEVIRRGKRSREGDVVQTDVAETYVPLMVQGRLVGVFEIYYDISERIATLDRVMARTTILLGISVGALLAIAATLLYRSRRSQAERDLAREEWEKTFEAVTDPIMIVSRDFTISRANRAMAEWIGVSREEAVGLSCHRHVHQCDAPSVDCPHRRLLEDGAAHSSEIYDARQDRYFSIAVYPIFDAAGILSGSVHYAKDITAGKKAEEELRRAETKYRIIADNTHAWEFWRGPDSRYIYTSPSCERITGYTPAEFADDPDLFLRIVHADDQRMVREHQQAMARGESCDTVEVVFRILRRDGTIRWIAHSCQPLYGDGGEFLGIRGSNSDITVRKHAVDSLQETASSLAEAQRIAHLGSWELDLTLNLLKGSEETYRIFEMEYSEQSPRIALLDRVHPDDRAMVNEAFSRSYLSGAPVEIVYRLLMPDGRVKFVHDRCETICEQGKAVKLVGSIQDVTEQRVAEEALRESEERFKRLAASAQDAIILMDGDGNVAFWNDSAASMFGYDRKEALGREVHSLIVPERFYRDYRDGFSRFQNTGEGVFVGKTLELLARKKDGTEFPVEFSVSALRVRDKWQAISIMRDITDRKNAERLIQQQLRNMTALSDIGMAISSTLDNRVTLKILLDRLVSQLDIDAASVLLLDQESLYLKCAASIGFRTRSIHKTSVRMGKGYAGQAAFERKILIIPDLSDTLTHALREEKFRAYVAVPLIAQGKVVGVLELFNRSSIDPSPDWLGFLELMAAQAAIAIDNASMYHNLQRTNTELTLSYDATLEGWGRTLEFRDEDTKGHTERVTGMAVQFARLMGLDEREIVQLRRGAMLHDIGKISIPDSILLKPGELTPEEREIMQLHTVYAYKLLKPIPFLRPALDIPYCHHEKWDGSGTPRGLKGEEIPLAARIFAVVDVWDALMSDRPYRKAWPLERVKEYIRARSGSEFDPRVVEIFFHYLEDESCEDIWNIREQRDPAGS